MVLLLACSPGPVDPEKGPDTPVVSGDTAERIGDATDTDTDTADTDTDTEDDGSDAVFDVAAVNPITLEMDAADWADIRDQPRNETWHHATFRWNDEEPPSR